MSTLAGRLAGRRRPPSRRPSAVAARGALLLCAGTSVTTCLAGWSALAAAWLKPPVGGRRGALLATVGVSAGLLEPRGARSFSPSDLGAGKAGVSSGMSLPQANKDPRELKESLYYISRVQEATVQQERLVSTGKFKDMQRNSIRMALNMMLDNYKLNDNIIVASGYANPVANVMKASTAGNEAVETLQTAQDYFAKDLKVAGLSDDQRKFVLTAMQATRNKLDGFLSYMPSDVVQAARKQVEDENDLNMKEFAGDVGTVMNPVKLPWKK